MENIFNNEPEDKIELYKRELREGKIDRRGFLKKITLLGLTFPVACQLAAEVLNIPIANEALAQTGFSGTRLTDLDKQRKRLLEIATSPQVISLLKELELTDPDSREEVALSQGTLRRLEEKGLKIPDSSRISYRIFENRQAGKDDHAGKFNPFTPGDKKVEQKTIIAKQLSGSESSGTLCASVGFIVCVSYGDNLRAHTGGGGETVFY